mgnify:CR=1 FL=1
MNFFFSNSVFGLSAAASITSDGETFTALPEE